MAIETSAGGTIITGEHITLFRMLAQKSALKLEILGIRNSRGSIYAMVKREYKLKGSRASVLVQFEKLIQEKFPKEG